MTNPFASRDVISTADFTKAEIEFLLDAAKRFIEPGKVPTNMLSGKMMASVFLEPSTRTRLSFDAAMKRLGGRTIGYSDWEKSSIQKGETMSDTLKVVQNYADVLVIRSQYDGAARYAADILDIPVINAGSGAQEHPTQALLDLLCIKEEKGKIDGTCIGLCGDLKYGRTIHSLIPLLVHYNVSLKLIAPLGLGIRKEERLLLESKSIPFQETSSLDDALPALDVLYMTRLQKERFSSEEEYLKVKGYYILTKDSLKPAKASMLLMHPLPRINEIDPSVDSLPQSVYFKQPKYGLYIRMALLASIFDAL